MPKLEPRLVPAPELILEPVHRPLLELGPELEPEPGLKLEFELIAMLMPVVERIAEHIVVKPCIVAVTDTATTITSSMLPSIPSHD